MSDPSSVPGSTTGLSQEAVQLFNEVKAEAIKYEKEVAGPKLAKDKAKALQS